MHTPLAVMKCHSLSQFVIDSFLFYIYIIYMLMYSRSHQIPLHGMTGNAPGFDLLCCYLFCSNSAKPSV